MTMIILLLLSLVLTAEPSVDQDTCEVPVTAILDNEDPLPGVTLTLRHFDGSISYSTSEPSLSTAMTDQNGLAVFEIPRNVEMYVVSSFPGLHWVYSKFDCDSGPVTIALDTPTNVSLIELIANPEKWNGKIVQLIGYLNLEFEGNAVYLHREDYQKAINTNAIWVDLSSASDENIGRLSGNYVVIRGRFDATRHGHMGLYNGTIREIFRCEKW
jgi:hypothetical protein